MRWAGHVSRIEKRRIHIGFWWKRKKERDYWEHLEIGGRIILKLIVDRKDEVAWTGFILLRIRISGGIL
jgi:hypothetical protein